VDLKRVPGIEEIADSALVGYLKVIADINREKSVLCYRTDGRLNHARNADQKVYVVSIFEDGQTLLITICFCFRIHCLLSRSYSIMREVMQW
jgi:hypothetical protein